MGKTVAPVLLKLFIDGNKKSHPIDSPKRMSSMFKCKQHTIHDPRGQEQ